MKKSLLFFALFVCGYASGQRAVSLDYYLPKGTTYNTAIPTPEQVLGYQVGEWHASHDQLVSYFKALDAASERITLETYGYTHERRPLLLMTVTSGRNQQNINEIKVQHKASAETGKGDIRSLPLVVWLGYTVHGNEPSGNNSAILTAYHLAAAQGPEMDSLLNETVVLIDPCINPDGANRFAHWVNANRSTQTLVTDPASREFNEPYPNARSNHYWFDLNRDYLYQQHPESQARAVKFHEWKPNVLTDHHEMGTNATFFFQPGIQSRVNPLTPARNQELTAKIGVFHAQALDKLGSAFYTQESFDDYYYGKGSSYPDANGCVGILFEQGSSRGHAQESINGIVTFPFTIRNQFTVSLSTLKAARAMRTELLAYQREFYQTPNNTGAYIFGGSVDKPRTWEMLNILRRNQIEVFALAKTETINGRNFEQGNAYAIPLNQKNHRLVKGMFDTRTTFQDSLFYDISAWTLPLAFGIPYSETKISPALGANIEENPFPKGQVVGESSVGYLFEWDSYFAPRALYAIQKRGLRVKVASEPLRATLADGSVRKFDYGSVEIPLNQPNTEGLKAFLETLADRDGVVFYGIKSGLTPEGIDLGSNQFLPLRQPKALLLAGPNIESLDAGEVWHLLDTRVAMPVTMVDIPTVGGLASGVQTVSGAGAIVGGLALEKYNVMVLPSGNYGSLNDDKIKRWVAAGGTLVAMGNALSWVAEKGLAPLRIKRIPSDTLGWKPYALAERYRGAQVLSGAIFQVQTDPTHPLLYGYKEPTMSVFRDNRIFLEKLRDPYAAPVQYGNSPLLAGYVSGQNERLLRNTPAVTVHSFGSGKVICFTDNPNFRGYFWGTNKMFLNALFFGNLVSPGRMAED